MPDKTTVAQELIEWHFKVEQGLIEVFWIQSENESSNDEPIKLLEVNENTPETGTVMPFGFAKTSDLPYRSVIAEITPSELDRIRNKQIQLPSGWDLNSARKFSRPITL